MLPWGEFSTVATGVGSLATVGRDIRNEELARNLDSPAARYRKRQLIAGVVARRLGSQWGRNWVPLLTAWERYEQLSGECDQHPSSVHRRPGCRTHSAVRRSRRPPRADRGEPGRPPSVLRRDQRPGVGVLRRASHRGSLDAPRPRRRCPRHRPPAGLVAATVHLTGRASKGSPTDQPMHASREHLNTVAHMASHDRHQEAMRWLATDQSGTGWSRRSTPSLGKPVCMGEGGSGIEKGGRLRCRRYAAEWLRSWPGSGGAMVAGSGDAGQASPLGGGRPWPQVR
jgi:hypothetical protein